MLHIDTDVFIEMTRFLPRSELEKMMLVSRRWSNIIRGAEGSLQQRRSFTLYTKFHGESPGMLSVHFARNIHSDQSRILRVLTTRGVSQALDVVLSHLRNAFVNLILPCFYDRVPRPGPPREMRVNIPLQARIDWLESMLCSMPLNSETGLWTVVDAVIGSDNLLALARCALEPHRKLGCVRTLTLGLLKDDATWAQLANVAIDTSGLRDILASWQSRKLHVFVLSGTQLQDSLLALPTQLIQDFVALRRVHSFVEEFSLHLQKPDNIAFPEIPDVDEATDRRKRFRYHHKGEDTVVRVRVYENPTAREYLSVVTFDHFRRSVVFFKGNVSPAYLKSEFQRPFTIY
ncbi:hypothetical protein AAVH_19456 [Aphelenchoides avenae]|nr:hypothetical protein AAVH_19456 [Aphelenchus avenae]